MVVRLLRAQFLFILLKFVLLPSGVAWRRRVNLSSQVGVDHPHLNGEGQSNGADSSVIPSIVAYNLEIPVYSFASHFGCDGCRSDGHPN